MNNRGNKNNVTKTKLLQKYRIMLLALLRWPLDSSTNSPLFSEEQIRFVRDTSDSMEAMRMKKNIGVISGSSASIIGGGLTIAGSIIAIIPAIGTAIGLGLLIPGIIIGTAGSGVGTGFSLAKFFGDRKKKKQIKPCLEKFVECLKHAVTAFVKIHAAFDIVVALERFSSERSADLLSLLHEAEDLEETIKREIKNNSGRVFDIIKCVEKHTIVILNALKDNKSAIIGPQISVHILAFDKIKETDEKPFEMLENSINSLSQYENDKKMTFLSLIRNLFEEKREQECLNKESPLTGATNTNDASLKHTAPNGRMGVAAMVTTVVGVDGATHFAKTAAAKAPELTKATLSLAKKARSPSPAAYAGFAKGLIRTRVTTTKITRNLQQAGKMATTIGQPVTETTKGATATAVNVGKVITGLAAAGIALGVIGITIDVAFIGVAIHDLCDSEKEDFPKMLDNTIEIMQKLNLT